MKLGAFFKKIKNSIRPANVSTDRALDSGSDARGVEHGGVPASHWAADEEKPR
jgi:hypothetical protein